MSFAPSIAMRSKLEITRTLIPWGYACRYEVDLEVNTQQLSCLAQMVIRDLIPSAVFHGEELIDIRGHEIPSLLFEDTPERLQPHREELFFLAGEAVVPPEEGSRSSEQDLKPRPFELRINTTFSAFKGSKHIVHEATVTYDWPLPPAFPLTELIPILSPQIECLRFGVDLFKGRFLSGLLGYSPVVTDTLQIEARPGQAALLILSESIKRRADLPLQQKGWFERTEAILRESCAFEMGPDYLQKAAAL